jgi:hypothetical protein
VRSASRGWGRGDGGWRWRPALRCGSGRRQAIGRTGKWGKHGITGGRRSLPHGGASAVACGGKREAERRWQRRPKRGGGRARALRVFGPRRWLQLGEELGNEGGGFIGRPGYLGMRARDTTRAGRRRVPARLELQSEPGLGGGGR